MNFRFKFTWHTAVVFVLAIVVVVLIGLASKLG